ncbi:MAG TPA: ankyrin repeat domain-containing protein [Gallionellaceae bacterium]|nr:ankyrin repeat domain-containing protein [Gallionellaceae bacterium]
MSNIQFKMSEVILLAVVILLSLAANLPDQLLAAYIDRKFLLIALATVIVVALFRYLRLLLFLAVVALAVGANLPEQLAESLGVSQVIMLAFLVLLVMISVLNYGFKMLPSENDKHLHDSADSRQAVLSAIEKGDLTKLHWLLTKNVAINFSENGLSPVILAAEKGYTDIMQVLVNHGADLKVVNTEGKTPMEIALARGFNRTAEVLHLAAESEVPKAGWSK